MYAGGQAALTRGNSTVTSGGSVHELTAIMKLILETIDITTNEMRNLMSSNKTHISKKIFIIISYAHTSGGSVHELAIMMIK